MLAICNTNGSAIPRECDAVLYTRAGPEIGVASTKKTFLAQIAAKLLCSALPWRRPAAPNTDEVERGTATNWKRCWTWWRVITRRPDQ